VVIGGSARMIDGAPAVWALGDMRQEGARAAAVIAGNPEIRRCHGPSVRHRPG
jgi:hypothetical protein